MFEKWWIARGVWLWVAVVAVPLIGITLIALLTQLPPRFRRPLISALVFLAGLFFATEYFWPAGGEKNENWLTPAIPNFIDPFSQILGTLLIGQGLYSITRIHVRNVARQRTGWINSFALLASIVTMATFAFWSRANSNPPAWVTQTYMYLFEGLLQNMDAAMFSLIAFYILSAAYRAFRIRSIESSILMFSALIVVLGLSFGVLLTSMIPAEGFASNFRIESWGLWLLTVVSSPALRAIEFGIGVGALAMALRLWLSIERGALFGD